MSVEPDDRAGIERKRQRKAEQRQRAVKTMIEKYGSAQGSSISQIRMHVGPWFTDEFGNAARYIRNITP